MALPNIKSLKISKGLIAVRAGVILSSLAATVALPSVIGVEGFGEFVCIWAMLMIGSRFVSAGTAKYLLKELPTRAAIGTADIPATKTIIRVVIIPILLSVAYGFTIHFANQHFDFFNFIAVLPATPINIAIGSFVLHLISVVAVGVRIKWGTGPTMIVRDASYHIAVFVTLGFLLLFSGKPSSGATLAGVIFVLLVSTIILIAALIRNRTFILSNDSPRMNFACNAFWANDLSGSIVTNFDVIMIGMLYQSELAGVYALVKRFSNLTSFSQVIANDWASVRVAKAFAQDKIEEVKSVCSATLKFTVPLAIATACATYVAATVWILYFELGNQKEIQLLLIFLLSANLVSVFFGQNFMLAAQSGFESKAFISRWSGVLLFCAAAALGRWLLPEVWVVGLCQLLAMSLANFLIWRTIFKEKGVDSSVMGLIT